jgi:hypothetical protein
VVAAALTITRLVINQVVQVVQVVALAKVQIAVVLKPAVQALDRVIPEQEQLMEMLVELVPLG